MECEERCPLTGELKPTPQHVWHGGAPRDPGAPPASHTAASYARSHQRQHDLELQLVEQARRELETRETAVIVKYEVPPQDPPDRLPSFTDSPPACPQGQTW